MKNKNNRNIRVWEYDGNITANSNLLNVTGTGSAIAIRNTEFVDAFFICANKTYVSTALTSSNPINSDINKAFLDLLFIKLLLITQKLKQKDFILNNLTFNL